MQQRSRMDLANDKVHFCAEVVEDGRLLAANVAAAHNHQPAAIFFIATVSCLIERICGCVGTEQGNPPIHRGACSIWCTFVVHVLPFLSTLTCQIPDIHEGASEHHTEKGSDRSGSRRTWLAADLSSVLHRW